MMSFHIIFQYSIVHPTLKSVRFPSNVYENSCEIVHLIFLLFLFEVTQHRSGEGSNEHDEDLLKWDHD